MFKQTFCLLVSILWAVSASAQGKTDTEKVYIDVNTGFSIVSNSFTRTWNPSPSFHVNVRLPFYAGQIEGGLRYIRFNSYVPTQTDSDFHSLFFHVGYNYPFKITSWYHLAPVFRFGTHLMVFDDVEVYTNQRGTERFTTDKMESEFAYELALRNQFQIANRLYLHAVLSYNRTFTYYPLPVTLFSIGISYSFPEPSWLNDFIK